MKVQIETRRAMALWIAWSLLAGIGLMTVIDAAFPEDWTPFVIAAIALGAVPWAIREHRWAGRQRKAFEGDMERLQAIINEGEK